ncbi:MAG: hypothetical protein IT523_08695 [Burkholderiales bacterium]|nr:hypothetical protein [Burkholderiales bacterium]
METTMWICLNDSFLSIVDKDCAEDELLVRARRDGDIERVFPDAIVSVLPGTDYRCRARIKRTEVAAAVAKRIVEIDYDNFKDGVRDRALHDAYLGVWSTLGRLQPGGPYSRGSTRSR